MFNIIIKTILLYIIVIFAMRLMGTKMCLSDSPGVHDGQHGLSVLLKLHHISAVAAEIGVQQGDIHLVHHPHQIRFRQALQGLLRGCLLYTSNPAS